MINSIILIEETAIVQIGIRAILAGFLPNGKINTYSSIGGIEPCLQAELCLINLTRPSTRDKIEAIASLKQKYPNSPIICYGTDTVPGMVRILYKAGIKGYFSMESDEILPCIRTVLAGKTYFPSFMVNAFVNYLQTSKPGKFGPSLTLRQYEVSTLLIGGFGVTATAERLGITAAAVSTIRKAVYKKLGIHTMPELLKAIGH
ncbi:LuxR C-terminal-related transcriptional regulator [Dyadobacter sp. BHUBP1]|uniref:LuxR C-terminal-related transcriptional regulator n=1 Tax=Dyadobacter sp. BHUBP1 TaxID=3424178 RepID=UPI003D349122